MYGHGQVRYPTILNDLQYFLSNVCSFFSKMMNSLSKRTSKNNFWKLTEYLWGLPLGQRLKDVRLKNRYLTGKNAASRKAQLNALGFVWNPKRGRRKQPIVAASDTK